MVAKRKFKVRVRGKVRNKLLRRGGVAAGVILGIVLGSWLIASAVKNSRQLLGGPVFLFKPQIFEVNCPSKQAYDSLKQLASAAVKKPLTSLRAREMAEEIRRLHPGLASVKISRNFITGKASINAVPEEAVCAVLLDGATSYLGATGRIMPEKLSGGPPDPFAVELRHAALPAPELAAFITELQSMTGLFYSSPASLSCDGRTWDCSLRLEDGSVVLWGGFEFNRLKILRLNEVMKDALPRSAGPLRADLRSFDEGKIFVSALKQSASPKRPVTAGT